MQRLLLRRAGFALLTLVVATVTIFLLIELAPGHVEKLVAERRAGTAATAETVAQVRAELGLDQPLPQRYVTWVADATTGNLGESMETGRPVAEDIGARAGKTFVLVGAAAVIAFPLGLGLAVLGAWRPNSLVDRLTRGIAIGGVSLPMFFLGALLIIVFGLKLAWFPTVGAAGPRSWVLPAVALGLSSAAIVSLVVRVLLEEAMSQPYIVTGRSRGASRTRLLFRDAFPNVAGQTVTVFLTQVGFTMVPGTIVVETIFAWHGVGEYFLRAVLFRDFPVMQAVLLLFVLLLVVLNLSADLIQAALDPRIRRSLRESAR
jgi:peptide/nickel transport system permease protein